jgi:heme/copper-type cytochrome/quinol oxidase subunit 2
MLRTALLDGALQCTNEDREVLWVTYIFMRRLWNVFMALIFFFFQIKGANGQGKANKGGYKRVYERIWMASPGWFLAMVGVNELTIASN